jgi:hypothetical protein
MKFVRRYAAPVLAVGIGGALFYLAWMFSVAPEAAFNASGHVRSALPAIMAGRYGAFGAVLLALVVLGEYRALAVVLAVGAGMGVYDAIVVAGANGSVVLHLGAAAFAAAGAGAAWWKWREPRSRMK